jgi:hypothetical protein
MLPVTLQTKGAHIRKIAFAAAFGNWQNVIGIPKRLTAFQPPGCHCFQARAATQAAYVRIFRNAIYTTHGAYAFIAFKNALAQMARVAAQTPFFHAKFRAERVASGGHFELAPTAQTAAVWALRKSFSVSPAAGDGAFGTHISMPG